MITFNASKVRGHSNLLKLEYVGKCLLIEKNKERVLVIGDLHLGYEEMLNRAGVYISRQLFEEVLKDFDEVFAKTGKVDEVVLLGDVKHGFGTITKQEWSDVLQLFDYLKKKCKKIAVVKGNHDKILEPIAKKRKIEVKDFFIWNEFCFLHGDKSFAEIYDRKIKCWVIGHGHPAVKLSDKIKTEKYKCFLIGKFKGKQVVVVPSFFGGNIGTDPRENKLGFAWNFNFDKFYVKIVSEDNLNVLDFGILRKL
jgi:hypothetical protein